MTSQKGLWTALIAVAIIAIGGYFFPQVQQAFGGITTGSAFPHGISVGLPATAPTNFATFKGGTCSLIMANFTIAASSSVATDCAVTGVVSTNLVEAWFASSTSNGAGWIVTQSAASSTAGFITLHIVNNTGASAVIPALIASSTPYFLFQTQ